MVPINMAFVEYFRRGMSGKNHSIKFVNHGRSPTWIIYKSKKERDTAYKYLLKKFVRKLPTKSFWDRIWSWLDGFYVRTSDLK